ncbi:hypothetical protein B0H10DRAFT_15308 [Mycena sp. CBHHK59/15]|nr:hypothetical protein B0H10DRAFT_15308 [Mycena sp. CBHHK59/15]
MLRPNVPPQQLLLVIENSSEVFPYWTELWDSYLPKLVEQLSGAQSIELIPVSIAESRPAAHDFHGSFTRQYSNLEAGLRDFQFNHDADNRLSTTQIQAGIEFLSAQRTSGARHLVIITANPPAEFGPPLRDPWQELAGILTQKNIFLHLGLTPNLRTGPLTNLFEQTLEWQQNIEEPLWLLTYSTNFIFRVAAQQTYSDAVLSEKDIKHTTRLSPPLAATGSDPTPPDIYTTKALDDPSSEPPSLVTQLQQVHGLTKKKVYGAKPVRLPFFKGERVRDKYRKAPTPLLTLPSSCVPIAAMPSSAAASPHGGRNRSNAKANCRSASRQQRSVDTYAPRQVQWMSSSEGESSDQSPSLYSSAMSSPTSPMAQMPVGDSYPFPLSSSVACQSMAPADPEPASSWASDNMYSPCHASFSSAPLFPAFGNDANVPLDHYSALQQSFTGGLCATNFDNIPIQQISLSTASLSGPPFLLSPLSTPYFSEPAAADLGGLAGNTQCLTNAHQQPSPALCGFPFPLQTTLQSHLPPPAYPKLSTHTIHAETDVPGSHIMQPIPIPPSICAPKLHDRALAESRCGSGVSHSLHAPKARQAFASAPSVSASSRRTTSRDGFVPSSSSLMGWAG